MYEDHYDSLMSYSDKMIYSFCKKSLHSFWTSDLNCEIVMNPHVENMYRYCFPTDDKAKLIPLLQSRTDRIHLSCMTLLSELCDCGKIFFSDQHLNALKLWFDGDTFFPSGYFYDSELGRLEFEEYGNGMCTPVMKKMLLIGIFIFRIYLANIFAVPDKYIKDYECTLEKRLKIRIVGSILYMVFAEYIGKSLMYDPGKFGKVSED